MTINIDTLFKNSDPIIADILNNALSDKEISVKEGIELYNVNDVDFHLVGLVANEIRRRRVGDIVSYVVNRNINFTMYVSNNVVFVHLVEILEKRKDISSQMKRLYAEQKRHIN